MLQAHHTSQHNSSVLHSAHPHLLCTSRLLVAYWGKIGEAEEAARGGGVCEGGAGGGGRKDCADCSSFRGESDAEESQMQGRHREFSYTTAGDTKVGDTTAGDTTAGDTTAGDTTAGDTAGPIVPHLNARGPVIIIHTFCLIIRSVSSSWPCLAKKSGSMPLMSELAFSMSAWRCA